MLIAAAFVEWFPWVLLAIALAALVALAVRFVFMYRNMKCEKLEKIAASREENPTLRIDGEYFVMKALSLYNVGTGKQLAAGKYLLKTQDGGDISLQINGVIVDYADGEAIFLKEGDTVRAEKDVGLKPEEE